MPTKPKVSAADFIAYAEQQLGKKYVFGTAGPNTFDCSGLITYTSKHFGWTMPHFTGSQVKYGKAVSKNKSAWLPGDLIFFNLGDGPNSHVGIWTGSQLLNAPNSRSVVRLDTMNNYYLSHVTAVRRLSQISQGTPQTGNGLGPNGTATSSSGGAGLTPNGTTGSTSTSSSGSGTGSSSNPLDKLADATTAAVQPITRAGAVADALTRAMLPSNVTRIICGILGAVFLCWGLYLLGSHMRNH